MGHIPVYYLVFYVLIKIRPQFQFAITQERREEGGGGGGTHISGLFGGGGEGGGVV